VHIIVVSDRLATAKSLTITTRHLVAGVILLAFSILLMAGGFSYVTLRHAAELRLPFFENTLSALRAEENERTQNFVRSNVTAIATKVGEMQAQLLQLDQLGDRLSAMVGLKAADLPRTSPERGGRGGPLVVPAVPDTATALGVEVDRLIEAVEARTDLLSIVEASLIEQKALKNRMPTVLPVDALWNASAYGWRADPFTGSRAMHEGVDFHADTGAEIVAAAGGVVVAAERHPAYGLMVEIDHGNDYLTRYAHASRLAVTPGQVVMPGEKIAEVGSTGRSTGPHLHFEVRYKGAAQNPARFLRAAQRLARR
jgi:murein DD-endopeptidase MepM/ murein hydrolase activator NlpD